MPGATLFCPFWAYTPAAHRPSSIVHRPSTPLQAQLDWAKIKYTMDLPLIFISVDRRFAIAQGVDLPDRCHGAVLFADISGFTPLTETLGKELGPKRGADEVTKQLEIIYGALIGEV